MKEIVGQNIEKACQALGVNAVLEGHADFGWYGVCDVYQVDDEDYRRLCDVKDEDWPDDWGWWRHGHCIYDKQNVPLVVYVVNGHTMAGYYRRDKDEKPYKNFISWCRWAMDISSLRNIIYFATSLAEHNGMTLVEFMRTFQGM